MPPVRDIIEELQFLSDRISEQTRTIALSILALVWLFLAGGESSPVLPVKPDMNLLLAAAGLALASLIIDYLQYVLGYSATNAARRKAEESNQKAEYDYADWRYRGRKICFWLKQVSMVTALSCLAVALFSALF